MKVLLALLGTKFKIFCATLFEKRLRYFIRNLTMAILLLLLLFSSYMFFDKLIFSNIVKVEDIGQLLIDRLVSIGFLIFFLMLLVSSFIYALGSLFRSEETEYLFSTPVGVKQVFTSKFFDIVIFSSWAVLAMALPILYSYAKVKKFGILEYALTGFVVIPPFVLIAISIGTITAIVLKALSRKIDFRILVVFAGIILVGVVYSLIFLSRPTDLEIKFTEDFRALNLFINNFQINSNPFTPNYWLIQCLRAQVFHNYSVLAVYLGALFSTAFFLTSLLYLCVDKFYYGTWLTSMDRLESKTNKAVKPFFSHDRFFSYHGDSQERGLVYKDILLFYRDSRQWGQFIIIVILLAVYFINLQFIPEDIELENWRTLLFIMNLAFCAFVLATLAVRFIYPSISLEGKSIWVLGSSPLSPKTLFREKLMTSFILFFIIAEPIGAISGMLLKLEIMYRILTFFAVFMMSISLSCIAVGMGAFFPDFDESNPSKIVSSPGGIMTVFISMIYIGLMLALFGIPAYNYTHFLVSGGPFPGKEILIAFGAALAINVVMIFIPLKYGAEHFEKREF